MVSHRSAKALIIAAWDRTVFVEDLMKASNIRIIPALAALAAGALVGTTTLADEAAPAAGLRKEEVAIPFVNHRNIRDWQADKDQGLWIQDERRNWYYASLLGPCYNLDWALHVGFDTRGSTSLDKFSTVVVPDPNYSGGHYQRCQFTSLTRSDPPPKKAKRDHKQKTIDPKEFDKQAVKEG